MEVLKHGCCRSHEHRGIREHAAFLDREEGVGVEKFPNRDGWNRPRRSVGIQQIQEFVVGIDVSVGKFEQGLGQSIGDGGTQVLAHLRCTVSRPPTNHTVWIWRSIEKPSVQ